MDKKNYEDAFRLLKDTGASEKSRTTIRRLVKLKGKNFLEIAARIADCVADCEKSVEAATNLREILELIAESGYEIEMTLDAGFARGLEYYTGMIFEIYVPDINIALGGGGRYDRLVELFGGEPTPAIGVAHGIDRIMLAMQSQKTTTKTREEKMTIVIPVKEELRSEALRVSRMLWNAGIPAEVEVMGRKVTKALEDADRRKMTHAVIVGERELKEDSVVLRDLTKRKQSIVKIGRVVESIRE
jgi:histidyl-tRNA synthetase